MPRPLKEFLQRWAVTTVGVLVATHVVRGIDYDHWRALLVATLVLGLLNAFIRPILLLLSLPFLIVTLGLFTLVINALLLYFVGWLVKSFHVAGFWPAFWGGLVISIITLLLNTLTGTGNTRVSIRRGRARRPSDKGEGGGPVIDV
jgi:putative membrane protein